MQIFSTPDSLKAFLSEQRSQGKNIGLVPTMGALHQGHLRLIRKSVQCHDITVCSIYVNPTQFNDREDLNEYPRNLDQDISMLKKEACQVAFCPEDQVMYPMKPGLSLDFGHLETVMEGRHRPGHFNGVALVVGKLFNIVQPDYAYFGEKDWQQLVIIKQMVYDFSFPLKIIGVPIVREEDGLAMSSRNQRLSPEHRSVAGELFKALSLVKLRLEQSERIENAKIAGTKYLAEFPSIDIEYLEIVRASTLDTPSAPVGKEPLSICLAAFLGKVRLIDNVRVFTNLN
jgi:pantoate--beta-alanine ligase